MDNYFRDSVVPALLQLVVNNDSQQKASSKASCEVPANFLLHDPRNINLKLVRSLLDRASLVLASMGPNYSDICSIIDDCHEMIGRKDCEPFANLNSDQVTLQQNKQFDDLP